MIINHQQNAGPLFSLAVAGVDSSGNFITNPQPGRVSNFALNLVPGVSASL